MNTARSGVFLSASLLIAALATLAAAPATGAGEFDPESLALALPAPAMVLPSAALLHMVEGAGEPALDDDAVRIAWSDGAVRLPDGTEVPISLDVSFRVGAAMAAAETTLTRLNDFSGSLVVRHDGGSVRWTLERADYDGFFPKAQHNPTKALKPLGVAVPVILRNESGRAVAAHLLLGFRYDPAANALAWNTGTLRVPFAGGCADQRRELTDLVSVFTDTPLATLAAALPSG
jgi:hypothetical protein